MRRGLDESYLRSEEGKRFNTEGTEREHRGRREERSADSQKWLSHLGAGLGRDGIGGFGVELVDDFAVVLFDDAALELEGKGEAAVVEGEILGENSKALDGFVLREMDGETLDLGGD